MMEAILERCAGLDVHQDVHQETVVACVLTGPLDRAPQCEIRVFGTMTEDLLSLGEWLMDQKCTHVAMESTGVYWKPVWNVLEAFDLELILANAHHIKNLPGRKTDMKDAEWIAKLLRCGLIEGSFVPSVEIRDLTRYRKKLVHDATSEKNRIHKLLQDANVKLTTHMSDVFGVSGRLLLQKIVDGEVITMEFLETQMKGALKHKSNKLLQSLNGRLRRHHRELIRMSWDHLNYIERTIAEVEREIHQRLASKQEAVDILTSIPGVNHQAASIILTEIGTDMTHFKSDHHLAAWAGVSPGNHESAGKKTNTGPFRKQYLKSRSVRMCLGCFDDTKYSVGRSLLELGQTARQKKALVALGHTLLRIIYHMLLNKQRYIELGNDYLERFRQKREHDRDTQYIQHLQAKGYIVTLA